MRWISRFKSRRGERCHCRYKCWFRSRCVSHTIFKCGALSGNLPEVESAESLNRYTTATHAVIKLILSGNPDTNHYIGIVKQDVYDETSKADEDKAQQTMALLPLLSKTPYCHKTGRYGSVFLRLITASLPRCYSISQAHINDPANA